jgi:hypothetical protein
MQKPGLAIGSALGSLFGLDPRFGEYVAVPDTKQAA